MRKGPPEEQIAENAPPNNKKILSRDYSFYSDDGASVCSSVESFLELRRPDPEEVLLELGFGPDRKNEKSSRIPARFLRPSKLLPHINIDRFLETPQTSSNSGAPLHKRTD